MEHSASPIVIITIMIMVPLFFFLGCVCVCVVVVCLVVVVVCSLVGRFDMVLSVRVIRRKEPNTGNRKRVQEGTIIL